MFTYFSNTQGKKLLCSIKCSEKYVASLLWGVAEERLGVASGQRVPDAEGFHDFVDLGFSMLSRFA